MSEENETLEPSIQDQLAEVTQKSEQLAEMIKVTLDDFHQKMNEWLLPSGLKMELHAQIVAISPQEVIEESATQD